MMELGMGYAFEEYTKEVMELGEKRRYDTPNMTDKMKRSSVKARESMDMLEEFCTKIENDMSQVNY